MDNLDSATIAQIKTAINSEKREIVKLQLDVNKMEDYLAKKLKLEDNNLNNYIGKFFVTKNASHIFIYVKEHANDLLYVTRVITDYSIERNFPMTMTYQMFVLQYEEVSSELFETVYNTTAQKIHDEIWN